MRLELTGFVPDADPSAQGILTDCDNLIPTTQGLAAGKSRVSAGLPALAAACSGAYVAKLLDGTKRVFAGTTAGLYESNVSSWTDRSRGGGYTGTNRWRFTMFGSIALATNKAEPIQAASAGGAFADIAGAPDAAIIITCAGFVMAFNFDDGTDTPDGWKCSGLYDHTIWTPSLATQSAEGRLLEGTGAITAGAPLGSDAIAYKQNSMYLGRYVGGSLIWQWQRIPGNVGTPCNEAVVVVQTRHFFIGPDDIYVFDGTIPKPIGEGIREWFFANVNRTYQSKIIGVADEARSLIYWYYPSTLSTSGAIDSCIVYNFKTGRWGKFAASIEAAVDYSYGQTTYDNLGTAYATYDDLPTTISYDSPFWLADSTLPAIIDTSHIMQTLTGTPNASYLVTGDFGDETEYTYLDRVSPRYRSLPVTATATNYYRDTLADARTQDATNPTSRNRFDFRRDAHFHSLRLDFTGAVGLNGLDVSLGESSRE
jgi:hypothetical protein